MNTTVHTGRPEDNLWESVLSHRVYNLEVEPRLSGLVASDFTLRGIMLAQYKLPKDYLSNFLFFIIISLVHFFEPGSHYVAQANHALVILLPQLWSCWCVPADPTFLSILKEL